MSRNVPTRVLVVTGIVVALLIAGVASFYSSSEPDGLAKVSEDKGFSDTEREHGAADGPLAGYDAKGVDDARLSGGAAGIVGSLVVLAMAGGVVLLVRRRRPADGT